MTDEVIRRAEVLIDEVAAKPAGEVGNLGLLYAAKANLEAAMHEPQPLPERWWELVAREVEYDLTHG